MLLQDADLATLAMVKAGLTLDHKDGTLLLDDAEELMFFTAEIAPDHYLYVELHNTWTVALNIGVFRRPRDHMSRMISASYSGLRIHRDTPALAGEEGELVEPLSPSEQAIYEADMKTFFARDRAIADELQLY